ncbi:hypothetical protein [Pseudonocardia sp. GCM10023141]|uniref:hypothetical protein n=1 Tax=Pseudonocardia sp. GCM10023141 TaxID=3252653 RepID=UPI0036144CB7
MKTLRAAIAVVALGAALTACGSRVPGIPNAAPAAGAGAPRSATGAPTGGPAAAPDAAGTRTGDAGAVEAAFLGYHMALLTRDWTTACTLAAPATVAKLQENLRTQSGVTAATCEEAFTAIYADPAGATRADAILGSSHIEQVDVAGDTATVAWSSTYNDQRSVTTSMLTRIAGKWLLLDTPT